MRALYNILSLLTVCCAKSDEVEMYVKPSYHLGYGGMPWGMSFWPHRDGISESYDSGEDGGVVDISEAVNILSLKPASMPPPTVNEIQLRKSADARWESFKETHDKSYDSPEEEAAKRTAFEANLAKLEAVRQSRLSTAVRGLSRDAAGSSSTINLGSYEIGINSLSDLSLEEFAASHCGTSINRRAKPIRRNKQWAMSERKCGVSKSEPSDIPQGPLPQELDWTKPPLLRRPENEGLVDVQNQGKNCKSCWAYTVESDPEIAFDYLSEHVSTDRNLTSKDPCSSFTMFRREGLHDNYQTKLRKAKIPWCISYVSLTYENGNEEMLKRLVATIGPIIVSVHANSTRFQLHKNGVYANDPDCSEVVDHAVLVVGYGTDRDSNRSIDYWKVQNSWGVGWGDNGFIRMARNQSNYCNISTYMMYMQVHDS